MLRWFCFLVLLGACIAISAANAAADVAALSFERDIRPILKTHCIQCHGESGQKKGQLDLRLKHLAVTGGKHGAALVPGHSAQSLILEKLRNGEMPPEKKPKLSSAEIDMIARWIDAGAATLRPEPQTINDEPIFTEEERNYWAFQPIHAKKPPTVKHADRVANPVDAFILAKLEEKGLSLSVEADKRTLIRRATFDLTGLPPTLAEVEAFLTDSAPDAYERLIDRLLASPRYGEHWGRHWLDVAGYADSEGYNEQDPERRFAWHYRDYVIRAINSDKPWDRFIVEQLAGDELLQGKLTSLSPDEVDQLTATGFLRMAPDGTAMVPTAERKPVSNQVVADEIRIVSTAFLGVTVGCAQCHDHRYDPITQNDYYRLRAIFDPAFDLLKWRIPRDRLVSLMSPDERVKAAKIETDAAKLDAATTAWEKEKTEAYVAKELAKMAPELREPLDKAFHTPIAKRTKEQTALLKLHPNVDVVFGNVANGEPKLKVELKKRLDESAALRAKKPVEEFVEALTEPIGVSPTSHLFYRGDCDQPKQAVEPSELSILFNDSIVAIPAHDKKTKTTGRRLAYAKRLTSGHHPLTGRVLVNRFWMHHFGRGLVGSVGDFGTLGEKPTHPELLDWLASDFASNGWKLKRLHKLLMMSNTYRQTSHHNADQDAVDPDNKLLGRRSLQRLEAEEFRDAVLAISGKLNAKMFGQPIPVMPDEVGQFVIGKENLDAGRPGAVIPMNGEEFRRSVYVEVRRSRPLSVLATFDEPPMEPNCEARKSSTVAPQALMLMNNDFVMHAAVDFANRVTREAGPDAKAQADLAWRLVFANEPTDKDVAELAAFLATQKKEIAARLPAKSKIDPALEALSTLGQAFWSANGFLYVD